MRKKRKYLTEQEINRVLSVSCVDKNDVRNKLIMLMCFIHGFRVSEVCNVKLSDLDIEGRVIQIHRLKNGFSTIHPLTKKECEQISLWLSERHSLIHSTNEWLFVSRKGDKLSRQNVYCIVRNYGKRAGLPLEIHPHMFRHSCGYALANKGVDTRLIQDYLGHKNIAHTVIYTASNSERFTGLWDSDARWNSGH